MMETGGCSAVAAKKATLTPKAIIYQKFGGEASYNVEEVQEPAEYGCPGLAIPHKGPSLYRCSLQLPGISVVSGTFKKKKDAEQSAAEMAIEKVFYFSYPTLPPFFFLFHWLPTVASESLNCVMFVSTTMELLFELEEYPLYFIFTFS